MKATPRVRKIALLGKFAYPELRLNTLADKACMSVYHFHRIYRTFTGEPINVTVRRMRLLKASVMLLRSSMSQQDIAKQVRYGSVAAFNRAFTKHYGETPDAYRKKRNSCFTCPTAFYPPQQSEYQIMYNVEQQPIPELTLIGLEHRGDYMQIGKAFEKLSVIANSKQLLNEQTRFFGLYYDDPKSVDVSSLRSCACISVPAGASLSLDPQLKMITVPASQCVTLLFKGDYAELEQPYEWLFGHWLPQSGLELADFPPFEEYLNDLKDTPPSELLTNICCLIK
ncbi:AraC family transcriptional regulator [Pseudoalteromonas citrea]|uniref:AraC family transcriptional regulator n=2 Tax=Pseudoalteromonas citrea TaxID=43655 RepID=A0A5S3XH04_9GAMM|nr:GyrI-like domain-containing protein [Pseudoalteromonas citrea]TMP52793.1 AraC family transcriptional regulator [Pseudoalteromonas citrea]